VFDDPSAAALQRNILGVVLHGIDDGPYATNQSDRMGVIAVETVYIELFTGDALDGKREWESPHGDNHIANITSS
jgi:hypothetical protein